MRRTPRKVLVCGGRHYQDVTYVALVLDELGPDCVIQGGAAGADQAARHWAAERDVRCQTFHADWEKHGRAAGPIRNQKMLDDANPDLVVAFPGGRGTADMVNRAKAAGVPVMFPPGSDGLSFIGEGLIDQWQAGGGPDMTETGRRR